LSIEDFVSQALPKGYVLQCCLRRDTSDVSSTTYSLYISNTFKHLLSARKKAFCATSNYALSTDKTDFDANSKSYMGKVRSNFLGTQFNGYSKGTNPDKATDQSTVRANIVTVNYQKNFFGSSGPRKM
jgi:tubby-related protein 1